MYFERIKEKHIYYVDFNPFKGNEFGLKHMAIVLRKNKNDRTLMVMPLTSKKDDTGKTIEINVSGLTENLSKNKSHAVFNKVRVVSPERFSHVMDKKSPARVTVSDDTYEQLIDLAIEEMECNVSLEHKIQNYKLKLDKCINEKIINLAYSIKKAIKSGDLTKIESIKTEMWDTIYNNNIEFQNIEKYTFSSSQKKHGIEEIITDLLITKKKLHSAWYHDRIILIK